MNQFVLEVYRVSQPGLIPKLIKVATRSHFNHLVVRIQIAGDFVYVGLDAAEGRQYHEEAKGGLPQGWEKELCYETYLDKKSMADVVRKIQRYRYSQLDNLIAFLVFWFPKLRPLFRKLRPYSLKTNCVGFVDSLLKRQLSYYTPGDWSAD